jgi:glycosyltransferase involved in cell wall biosynthesis
MQHFQNLPVFKRHQSQKMRQDRAMASISIVTVVKNNAVGLTKTLKSALSQDFADWELIIVYGQSEDSTYDIATEFCKLDSRFSLVRQSDQGIYEAMNLGIGKSRTDFLWFMNSGDQFYSVSSLDAGFKAIKSSQNGFVVGGYKIDGEERVFRQSSGEISLIKFALSRRGACHQAMVFRKDSIMIARNFDTRFRLAADQKLCLEIIKDSGAIKIGEILAIMEPDGFSDKNLKRMHEEKALIRAEIFANNPMASALGWVWMKAASIKAGLRLYRNGKKHPLG